jgi:hypothetical protein
MAVTRLKKISMVVLTSVKLKKFPVHKSVVPQDVMRKRPQIRPQHMLISTEATLTTVPPLINTSMVVLTSLKLKSCPFHKSAVPRDVMRKRPQIRLHHMLISTEATLMTVPRLINTSMVVLTSVKLK